MGMALIFIFLFLLSSISSSYGYDSLDPDANITITWDLMLDNGNTYDLRVSLYNFQLFRHVERPGWKLSWTWKGDEAIWDMWGAEATQQGNCSRFRGQFLPHCCEKQPVIVDLMPGARYNKQFSKCCKEGLLSSMTQDPSMSVAAFRMNVNKASAGNISGDSSFMPMNFNLGLPGYTCGVPFQVPPTMFKEDGSRRWTQALETWNVTCIYSQFQASPAPKCCVSLSAFYNSTIVPCPQCSCNCQGLAGGKCVKSGETPSLLEQPHANEEDPQPLVRCSPHMCPIQVHWHVKNSYREYWRVKITITNLNFVKNYSMWNLVVLHPNLGNVTQVFSFNYHPLNSYAYINDTGMFWGIQYYNDMLLQSGPSGNVQTEMLLHKVPGIFTFREGWTFPRRITFNGDECVMPPPDQYPRLPNTAHTHSDTPTLSILSFSLLLLLLL
ncbi:hypothetical protein F2P56_036560 [Juglans regia]|uniref:COBRA-like protein n=2 Tax=Juglans regia TaxID=51240 RepID=A0A833WV05_JUGRE|nr:COBRA-like protein 6 [Juglans regia]KAF5444056.1 hypothetical protein F2P56_036560 [Juglans regia]